MRRIEQLLFSDQGGHIQTPRGAEQRHSGAGGLLVKLRELLEDGGDVGHPLPDLGRGAAPGELRHDPGPALSLRVDVGDHGLPLPRVSGPHYELRVVLEVVDLQC